MAMTQSTDPEKDVLLNAYQERIPRFERVLAHLRVAAEDFKRSTDPHQPILHSIKSRIKNFHS